MKNNYSTVYEYISDSDYKDLYTYFKLNHDYSSRVFKYIIRNGRLTVNGKDIRFVDNLKKDDHINVYFPTEKPDALSRNLEFGVIYEDEDILIADKPPNMVVHPTRTHQEDTLSNAVYYHWEKTGYNGKARFVNRIDMDTTGIVVIAKNKYVHHFIQNQGMNNLINKNYLLITNGIPKQKKGIIDKNIMRSDDSIIQRKIDENGKKCITEYEVIDTFKNYALIKARLITGRTHQIRVHFSSVGCPLLGDTLYNLNENPILKRQALHSYSIDFIHPRSKKRVYFTSPLPKDFNEAIFKIKKTI